MASKDWSAMALRCLLVGAIAFLVLHWPGIPAFATERHALLIGNERYVKIGALGNPVNDIQAIDDALRVIGFAPDNITRIENASRETILHETQRYGERLRAAGSEAVGFFFYAGHGVARGGTNYLVPVEADGADIVGQSISLDDVIGLAKRTAPDAIHFFVSDACRNVPSADCDCDAVASSRSVGTGWAESRSVQPLAAPEPDGDVVDMLVAYSTQAGRTASDAGAELGPYVAILHQELVKPDLSVREVFDAVRRRVFKAIGQQPIAYFGPEFPAGYYLASASQSGESASGASFAPSAGLKLEIQAMKRLGLFEGLAGARVLWLDDNPANNYFERNELRMAGILVDIAMSTDEALEKIWLNGLRHYDLIISDYRRWGDFFRGLSDGYALLDRINEFPDPPDYVFYTHGFSDEEALAAEKRGAMIRTADTSALMKCIRESVLGPHPAYQCPRRLSE